MLLREISWSAGVTLAVGVAVSFLCTENFFPHPQYFWALYF